MTTADNVVSLRDLAGAPDVAGDHLNAQRFLTEYGDIVRRAPELGRWYIFNGAWWEEDRLDRVLDMAADTIDRLRLWVAEATGPDEFKRRGRHYEGSAKAGRRDALLAIAGTDRGVVVGVDQLDAHPHLLACRNGTVDLFTGELKAADPADLLTRGVDIDYHPEATSERFTQFIETTFGADRDLIAFVQRLLGYCCTGIVHEHVLPVCSGLGANGKSTLVGVLQDILGEHAMTAPEGLVIRHDHEPHPERIAALRGRRLVVSNELEAKAVLAEQTVKMLTGGDTLSARELYGRRFNFTPTHKVVLVTNHRPKVRGTDHAIWRRIRVLPFETIIPVDQQDPDLRRSLVEDHGSAVLAWLVQGARSWHEDGLGSADAVDVATEAYKATQDTFGAFLDECTVAVEHTKTKVGELFSVWRQWCERNGERPGRMQDFSAALEDDHDFVIDTYQNAKFVLGLGILEVGEVS
jgi:putative DNA primase/helicase